MGCRRIPLTIGVRLKDADRAIDVVFRNRAAEKTCEWARNNYNRCLGFRLSTRENIARPRGVDLLPHRLKRPQKDES
jgi:hypothetical protein